MFNSDVDPYDSETDSVYSSGGGNEDDEEQVENSVNQEEPDIVDPENAKEIDEDGEGDEPDEEALDVDIPQELSVDENQANTVNLKNVFLSEEDSLSQYDSDDSDMENEEMLYDYEQKIDSEFKFNFIKNIHPEEIHDDYNEMNKLCNVTRDENNIIIDKNHTTYPLLSKYEKTRLLGLRISQLNKGAKPYIQYDKYIIDNNLIALEELKQKKLPFIIMRPIPNGKKEYWRLSDLEII